MCFVYQNTIYIIINIPYPQLKTALSDAQKNASLLAEYHELYELQRRRLESQVFMLTEEREIWSTASYSLAMKVTFDPIVFLPLCNVYLIHQKTAQTLSTS